MTRTVELTFPAAARHLVLARLGIAGIGPVAHLDESTVADLKLAVTEACANAVRHAYPEEAPGQIRVRMILDGTSLLIEVADDGNGFDPEWIQEWDPSSMREEGMGFEIMRSVMDEVEVESQPQHGTVVRLRKRLVV